MRILGGFSFIYIYDKSFVQELKAKVNLVDIISRKLNVTRKGKNYWACCPFHQEKTPSFSINELDQYYHCFGCGKSGDVITFLEENDNLTYNEAVLELCGIAGIEPPKKQESEFATKRQKKLDSIYHLNKITARRYRDNLFSDDGRTAREYLEHRGINSQTAATFGLGYSKDFNDLLNYLENQGYSYQSMLDAGIVAQGDDGSYYDALGNRIIVPIINQNNDVIGFGGRIIKGESNAKYKNTAQTLAFDKRKNLFGINILKKEKRENNFDYAILVEGYMDVISLYQAGITNSVASMGTSLTIEQCELFKKTRINKVIVSFDGDTAGQAATMRSLDLLSSKGIEVKVISLLAGLDPDDTVKRYGKNGFLSLVDNALPLIDFKLKKIEDYYDLSIINNRSKYANTCIELLATLEDELAANVYLDLVSKNSGTTIEVLREALIKRKTTPKPFFNNSMQFQDTILKNEKSREVKKGLSSAEDIVASAIINKKAFSCIDDIKDLTFVNDLNTVIINYIKEQVRDNKRFIIGDLFSLELDKEEIGRLSEVINSIDEKMVQKVYNDALLKLKKNSFDSIIKSLNIKYITSDNEEEKKEIINKIKELKQLQFTKKE